MEFKVPFDIIARFDPETLMKRFPKAYLAGYAACQSDGGDPKKGIPPKTRNSDERRAWNYGWNTCWERNFMDEWQSQKLI